MPDNFETTYGFNPLDSFDLALDADGDGLTNLQEFHLGSDPVIANADSSDSDLDAVADYIDNCPVVSNADQTDTDSDGTGDVCDDDDDGDGMPDSFEILYVLNPIDASDATTDLDGDGVSNYDEYINGTSPKVSNASAPASSGGGGLVSSVLLMWLLMIYGFGRWYRFRNKLIS